ncbi:hypothetical protein CsSME_00005090 [Camellia sinensis var. sinensis]
MVGFEVGAVLADWTRNYNPTRNFTNPYNSTHPSDSVFDFTGGGGADDDDDATFHLVDSKPPSRPRFGPKWRF